MLPSAPPSKSKNSLNVVTNMRMTFLGTCAGKPSLARNASSLGLQLDGSLWLFDVAEATQHQLMKSNLKLGNINKIFITHMHGDHTYGLAPLMLCFPEAPPDEPANDHVLDIYGPSGLRQLIRYTFQLTYARPARRFRVHEILFPGDPSSLNEPFTKGEITGSRDIHPMEDGTWLVEKDGPITVRAAPIKHTVPCLGYVLEEDPSPASIGPEQIEAIKRNSAALVASGLRNPMSLLGDLQRNRAPIDLPDGTTLQPPPLSRPGRKLAILGDTYDGSAIIPLAQNADVVVHEATNAFIASDAREDETLASVRAKAKAHGHSTPEVAGAFAKACNAKRLILNHLTARYPTPEHTEDPEERAHLTAVQAEIERLAAEAFGSDAVTVSKDFLAVDFPKKTA